MDMAAGVVAKVRVEREGVKCLEEIALEDVATRRLDFVDVDVDVDLNREESVDGRRADIESTTCLGLDTYGRLCEKRTFGRRRRTDKAHTYRLRARSRLRTLSGCLSISRLRAR